MNLFLALSLLSTISSSATAQTQTSGAASNNNLRAVSSASSSSAGIERQLAPNAKGKGPCGGICNAYNNAECLFNGDGAPEVCTFPFEKNGCTKLCEALDKFECNECGKAPPKCSDIITVDVDASSWDSTTAPDYPFTYPITGSGQCNGHFKMYEYEGVQYGMRIKQRGFGPIIPSASGMYTVKSGSDTRTGEEDVAYWNIDFHTDLPDDKTIVDYGTQKFSIKCIMGDCGDFGVYTDLDYISNAQVVGNTWKLFQSSQNPNFGYWPWNEGLPAPLLVGDDSYDMAATATYELTFQLGALCPVSILVSVEDGDVCDATTGNNVFDVDYCPDVSDPCPGKVETTVVTGTHIPQTGSAVTYDPAEDLAFPCLPYYEFPPASGNIVDNSVNFNGGADCPFLSEPFVANIDVGSTSSFSFEDDAVTPGLAGAPFPTGAICGSSNTDPADKFSLIYVGSVLGGNDLADKPLGSLESVKYSFFVKGCQNSATSCPDQFYLNIYARLPTSGNFYDCNFAFVPSSGGDIDTWTTFDLPDIKSITATTIAEAGASQTSTITGSNCQGYTTIEAYLAANPTAVFGALLSDGITHWTYQLNIGDTTLQTGLEGCFDGIELKFTDETSPRIYDFEPDA